MVRVIVMIFLFPVTHCHYKHPLWEIFITTNRPAKYKYYTNYFHLRQCDDLFHITSYDEDEEMISRSLTEIRTQQCPSWFRTAARGVHYDYQTCIWALRNYDSGVYDMEISINMIGPYCDLTIKYI